MINQFFYDFFKKNIKMTILYLITMIYIPLRALGMPHIYGKLISNLKSNGINNAMFFLTILIILWTSVQAIKIISNHIHSKIFPKFLAYVRDRIVEVIIDRYKNNYQDLQMGDTITKIIKTPWLLEDIFDIGEDFVFRNVLLLFSSFVYLTYYNKKLGAIYLICIIVIIFTCKIYINKCQRFVKESETTYDKAHEEIEDTLSNLLSVYTSQKVEFEKKRLNMFNLQVYKANERILQCNNKHKAIFAFLCVIIFIVLNYYSIHIYKKKHINLEILIAIIIINYSILSTLMGVYYYSRRLGNIIGRTKVFTNYINNLPHSSKDNILKINNRDISIHFKNINFSYSENDKKILKNINLTIKNNELIGLVGHIGSGKSTLMKLLVRLKEPTEGEILINNINIKNINLGNLRNNINLIPQHPKLFNRTLFSNIVYGVNKKVTETEIYKIIDSLDIKNIRSKFKKMMYKNVGKNGSNLSGGQRQLVWLIRSILKDSKVIILDEPTSSLDENSKIQVIKFIKSYSKDKIIILITHDKSLLKYVNRVIELKNGEIIKK